MTYLAPPNLSTRPGSRNPFKALADRHKLTDLMASRVTLSLSRCRFAARPVRAIACVLALAVAAPSGGRADSLASRPSEMPMVFVWRIDKQSKEPSPAGSGFLLGADGVVVTAKHVAAHNEYQDLAVSISRKNAPPVPVMKDVDCDQVYDFCLLRILDTDVKDARIDPADFYALACRAVEVEETVLAYGFLPGNNGVSHPDGKTTTGTIDEGLILTTVDLEPSMSGGPVFDTANKVVAIVNGGAVQQSAVLSIRPALPLLLRHGYSCPDGTTAGAVVRPDAAALSGIWQDKDGATFFLGRNEDTVAIDGRSKDGTVTYQGSGTIAGTDLEFKVSRRGIPATDSLTFNAYSGECQNSDSGGCTIEDEACAAPPSAENAFDPATAVARTVASQGVNVDKPCHISVRSADRVCVIAHAESGSGVLRIGQIGSRTCEATVALTGRDFPAIRCTGAMVSPTMIMASCIGADGALYPWILVKS